MSVAVAREAVVSPDALRLIAESEAELAAVYPPGLRYAFSPEERVAADVVFLIARRCGDGAAVACGGVAPLPGYGEIKRLYARPEARGSGAARAVVAALEAEARGMALPLMRLETGEASPAALRLYEALGYARRPAFGTYAENGSSVFMEKAL